MRNLTEEELKKMVANNPDVTIVDDGTPMGDKPTFEFKSMKEIIAEVGEAARAREYTKEERNNPDIVHDGYMLTIEHEPELKFKSLTEKRAFAWLKEQPGVIEVLYEPIMVRMDSGNYTPDFLCRMDDRTLRLYEVKGSWKAYQSGRSSKKSLKEAAKQYWFFGTWFSLLPKKGGGWNLEEIK